MAFFLGLSTARPSRPPGARGAATIWALLASGAVLSGAAGCASPSRIDRLERRLERIEQQLGHATAAGSMTTPTAPPSAATPVQPADVEIARLRADIDDIRLLLLDLQMKAGR